MNIGKFIYSKNTYNEYRQKKFFGGLITIDIDYAQHTAVITAFNTVLIKSKLIDVYRNITLGSGLTFKYKRNIPILNKILKKISPDYDDIYICKHHIGEIYIFCQLMKQYIKNNGSKKPLLIIPKSKYISLYEILCPDIEKKFINLNLRKLDLQVTENILNYRGRRFFVPVPDRFAELRNLIVEKGQNIHFYDYLKKEMNIDTNTDFQPAFISDDVNKRVQIKAKELGLDLNKFVIFSPEAVTAMDLSHTFWIKLGEYFADKGYQIYINTYTTNKEIKPEIAKNKWLNKIPNSIKNCAGFDEIYCLAQHAKGVIALVNGLVVTFTQINTPRFFMYTNQTPTVGARMDADTMLKSYRLDYLPGAYTDTLHEINLNEMSEKEVFRYITNSFDKFLCEVHNVA